MLCLSGFELYSRWVPLYFVFLKPEWTGSRKTFSFLYIVGKGGENKLPNNMLEDYFVVLHCRKLTIVS